MAFLWGSSAALVGPARVFHLWKAELRMPLSNFLKALLTSGDLFGKRCHVSLRLSKIVKLLEAVKKSLFVIFHGFFRKCLKIVDGLLCVFPRS